MELYDITNNIYVTGDCLAELMHERVAERLFPTHKPVPVKRKKAGIGIPMTNTESGQIVNTVFDLAVLLDVNYGWLSTQIRMKGKYLNWIKL